MNERTTPRIALVQTTTTGDFEANLAAARSATGEAAAEGAALVAFPEVFLYIGSRQGRLDNAQTLEGETVGWFREAAARHGMMILLGSVHERIDGRPDKLHNTSILVGDDGAILAVYRKLKLFDVELPHIAIRESDVIEPGDAEPPVVETPVGRIGLTVCFDLRFSDLYLDLRRRGAELIFVPSNFTAMTGAAHWELLLRARAVENQVWVAAPAQVGKHNPKYSSWGHSALVDPWGVITAQAGDGPGIVYGGIDLEYLRRVRRELPMGI